MKKVKLFLCFLVGLFLCSCGSNSIFLVDSNCLYEYDRANNVYRLVWQFKAEKNLDNKDSLQIHSVPVTRQALGVE